MPLIAAEISDLQAVADLVNSAYRGDSARQGWTHEADYLGGQRTDAETLRRDMDAQPDASLLVYRDEDGADLLGCVWLEPVDADTWYLGLLTVRPDLQDRRLGRTVLEAAEVVARQRGAVRMRMTVVNLRDTLIDWYRRRGYELTGETRPFPYDDLRFGEPQRDDLQFVVMEKAI